MNNVTAYNAVCAYFSARRCQSVRRLELMKLERAKNVFEEERMGAFDVRDDVSDSVLKHSQ